MERIRSRNGFTFVELLVVITIIGIIFASGIVTYSAITTRSRDARRKSDVEAIRQALEMCRSLTGEYPDSIYPDGVDDSAVTCSVTGPTVMNSTPSEPTTCPENLTGEYVYVKMSDTQYTLTSECTETGPDYQVTNP